MYVQMTSKKTLLEQVGTGRHSPRLVQSPPVAVKADQIYVNDGLGPNDTYTSLIVQGPGTQSCTNIYADVNKPINQFQDDSNVYSVPKTNALRHSMSDSSVDGDGYIALSLKRDDGK